MNTHDTIIAPATALGGGIAIIRISGQDSLTSLSKFFNPSNSCKDICSHQLYHGHIVFSDGEVIDEVMVVYMAAPRSYTTEDVVEIHCHGSYQVVKKILELYQQAGLRLAEPGEFTYRAFINGRIDLSQAEGVASLIHSASESARTIAYAQADGALTRSIYSFTDQIKEQLVFFEAWIDFPEENIPPADFNRSRSIITQILADIDNLSDTYNQGKLLLQGASILLVGQPNVGKSSLMNYLLGEERAIVTDTPGTTRDLLEEGLTVLGMPVRLIDTAGIRAITDNVEKEGVKRAEHKLNQADLILVLLDSSKDLDDQDRYIVDRCGDLPHFYVWTKIDLGKTALHIDADTALNYYISTKSGEGIDSLRAGIVSYLLGDQLPENNSVILSEQRHYEALLKARTNLQSFLNLSEYHGSDELLAFELRESLYWLGQISGETTTESLLDDIFSGFCIGK